MQRPVWEVRSKASSLSNRFKVKNLGGNVAIPACYSARGTARGSFSYELCHVYLSAAFLIISWEAAELGKYD